MSRKDITIQDVFLATKELNSRIGDTTARAGAASSVADILQKRPDLSPTEAVELIVEEGKN
ncbi:MAG: hypothetical protein HYU64_19215 [Armatimonadetes bacterium]|nr:hypothetical protein [Armatimonadota bacterium]